MNVLLPESAPVRTILLAWPFAESDWKASLHSAETCYFEMLCVFSNIVSNNFNEYTSEVWVLLHPSVSRTTWEAHAINAGVNFSRVKIIHDIAYNDTWIRDYGPLSLSGGYCTYRFNGWGGKYDGDLDNSVSRKLASHLGTVVLEHAFVAEGGALEINNEGVLLANEACVVDKLRNPDFPRDAVEQRLQRDLGVKEFIWLHNINLTGDDTDGHIDTLARFAEEKGVVCCGRQAGHHDEYALEKLNRQLESVCATRGWALFTLPVPVIRSQMDNRLLPATYANFLLVNGIVFAPIYGVQDDSLALEVLQDAYPSYQIVPVRCEALLEQHGSLHCATMQISMVNR